MKLGSFDVLVRALDSACVRYLVAGRLAVNAHGYGRFTCCGRLLQLSPKNIASAFGALETAGYRPIVPVPPRRRRQRHDYDWVLRGPLSL